MRITILKLLKNIMTLALCATLAHSCKLIDDDLSDCGKDLQLQYQLSLQTNLELELNTVLSTELDMPTHLALNERMSNIFTDHAHDIDIMFYKEPEDQMGLHKTDIINSNQTTYTIFLPARNYHHLSLANLIGNTVVSVRDTAESTGAKLQVLEQDTVVSQETGLFAASLPVEVTDTADQVIEVKLRQVNSAVALVIDTAGYDVKKIEAFIDGTASGFMLRDSVFLFDRKISVRTEQIDILRPNKVAARAETENVRHRQMCFTGVCMPSPDMPNNNGAYFTVRVYVTLLDGTITETILHVRFPLPAGWLKIVKTRLQDNGVVAPDNGQDVGASVTLDWKDGREWDIPL